MLRMRGERRRAIALASLTTLAVYLGIVTLAKWLPSTQASHIILLDWWKQVGILTPIWLGAWLIALAQRQLLAHGEGAYTAFLAFTQVRGMRFLGLILSLIMAALLGITFFAGSLSARDGVIGLLATLALLALGLPDAPEHTYRPPQPDQIASFAPNSGPSRDIVPTTIARRP